MFDKKELLKAYPDPIEKYKNRFIDFEMMLGDNREHPDSIGEMLDVVSSVYDYYSALESYVEEEKISAKEEVENVEAEIREVVQNILIQEGNLPKSKPPTGEAIKARSRIMFNKYLRLDPLVKYEDRIRAIYRGFASCFTDEDAIKCTVNDLWKLMTRYHKCYAEYRKMNYYSSIMHGRTNALKMRKDTIIETVRLIKNIVTSLNLNNLGNIGKDTEMRMDRNED
jgi:hypothetical protein